MLQGINAHGDDGYDGHADAGPEGPAGDGGRLPGDGATGGALAGLQGGRQRASHGRPGVGRPLRKVGGGGVMKTRAGRHGHRMPSFSQSGQIQGLREFLAARKTLGWIFRHRPHDHFFFRFGHRLQIGRAGEVIGHHLGQAHAAKHAAIQTQLGIGERQGVLIAVLVELAGPDLRSHVSRSAGAGGRNQRPLALEAGQPEIRHFNVALQKKNIIRLDIAMLDAFAVQEIEGLARLAEIRNKFLQRDTVVSFLTALLESAAHAAVRQLHDDV